MDSNAILASYSSTIALHMAVFEFKFMAITNLHSVINPHIRGVFQAESEESQIITTITEKAQNFI